MKELIGSEKQIRWAEDIRRNAMEHYANEIAEFDETIAEAVEDDDREWADGITKKRDLVVEMYEKLESASSAGWWIDMRGRDLVGEYKLFKKFGRGAFTLLDK